MRTRRQRLSNGGGEKPVRISVSVPPEQHTILEKLADEKRVSVAWVVRDAIEQYLENQLPAPTRKRKTTRR